MNMKRAIAERVPEQRFDALDHRYFLDHEQIPHITTMLSDTGWIDDAWFTAESSERGQIVHRLCADYDLGAIPDPAAVECKHKGFFLAYVKAIRLIKPRWKHVETVMFDLADRWCGRPDRVGKLWGAWAVLEIKTGVSSKATPVQLALQAILAAPELHLAPEQMLRYELKVRGTGKGTLLEHRDPRDFDRARKVIRECCGR